MWPFKLIWGFFGFLFGVLGRLLSVIIGIALIIAGIVLCLTVIGAIAGVPILVFGFLMILKSFFP